MAAWRQRMGTEAAKKISKQRAAIAETVNADAKQHRRLDRLAVRSFDKALGSASLLARTYNILRPIGKPPVAHRRAAHWAPAPRIQRLYFSYISAACGGFCALLHRPRLP